MNPERVKFYIELMKSLTSFILGTGAGIYGLITTDKGSNLLFIFVLILCLFATGVFVALFVYMEKNIDE